jgi:hypothetical protein
MNSDTSTTTGRVKELEKIETPDVFDQDDVVVYEGIDEDESTVYVVGMEITDEEREQHNDHRILPDGEVQLEFVENPEMEKIREVSGNVRKENNLENSDQFNQKENFDVQEFLEWIKVCKENTSI